MVGHNTEARADNPFLEEAVARGINYLTLENPNAGWGRGLAFTDLDNDGDPDLVAVGDPFGAIGIFENIGNGFFLDRTGAEGMPTTTTGSGISAGDYDGDGDPDIYISNWNTPNLLLRNDGNFNFTDVAAAAGVNDSSSGTGTAWGDYDGDGRLDLYLANYTAFDPQKRPNRLFHNLGGGVFVDVAAAQGVADIGPGFQPVFWDYDRDGDSDLYLSNDRNVGCSYLPHRNRFWRNDGGNFVDITEMTSTGACINAMGISVGDFTSNGYDDIFIANTQEGNYLYKNLGNETFEEVAVQTGVVGYHLGWGTYFFDYDNNARLDLYICNQLGANSLFIGGASAPSMDLAGSLQVAGMDESYCMAAADIDGDGDVDFAVQNADAYLQLYINQSGSLRNWAGFRVVGPTRNRAGVGAQIAVRTGSRWQYRDIRAGSNYKSQNDLTAHFGLNRVAIMDEITAYGPAIPTRTLTNYPANHVWRLVAPSQLGDANDDGHIEIDDFAMLQACVLGAVIASIQPGCEVMDLDSDGDVDLADYASFQRMIELPESRPLHAR